MINVLRPDAPPLELLRRRLGGARPLRSDDVARFGSLDPEPEIHLAGEQILVAGQEPSGVRLVAAGLLAETRALNDGRRQITALRLPGDLIGAGWSHGGCDTWALTAAQTVGATPLLGTLMDPVVRFDPLRSAWAAARREDEARMADHLVRLGRLSAHERMAHLLLELHERLLRVGLASAQGFPLPLTQEVLADVLGLSIVHVNRTLQQLRREGLLVYRSGQVTLPDRDRLTDIASYVAHADPPPRRSSTRPTLHAAFAQPHG